MILRITRELNESIQYTVRYINPKYNEQNWLKSWLFIALLNTLLELQTISNLKHLRDRRPFWLILQASWLTAALLRKVTVLLCRYRHCSFPWHFVPRLKSIRREGRHSD